MKKILVGILIFSMLLPTVAFANTIDVIIDGVKVNFDASSGAPFIENGRTLVPLRASMEALGAEVSWDNDQSCAIVKKGPTTVVCYIGDECIYNNSEKL